VIVHRPSSTHPPNRDAEVTSSGLQAVRGMEYVS
jgi:hypothetical protein